MKKIGIITFHASYNCGSILQTIALQETIWLKFGLKNEVINFSNKEQRDLYSVFYKKFNCKNLVKNMLCIPGKRIITKQYEEYRDYIEAEICMSSNFYPDTDSLDKIDELYDGFICGSDQVWNVKCDDFDDAYFLCFAKSKPKIAYAPSLGATDIRLSENREHYKKLISDFTALSTRENNGSKWIGELAGEEVPVVLDPTLLVNQDFWESKIRFVPDSPFGDYIFYYAFGYNDEFNFAIDKLAQEHNLKVVIIDAKQWFIKRLYRFKSFYLSESTGPNAFLYFLKNSEYVVTASFHGCALSITFHKQFIYLKTKNHEPSDDRASGMLEHLGLTDRTVSSNSISFESITKPINYQSIDDAKKNLQKDSLDYLEVALKKSNLL